MVAPCCPQQSHPCRLGTPTVTARSGERLTCQVKAHAGLQALGIPTLLCMAACFRTSCGSRLPGLQLRVDQQLTASPSAGSPRTSWHCGQNALLGAEGRPVHCRALSSIRGPYPFDARSVLPPLLRSCQPQVSKYCPTPPGGQKSEPENHCPQQTSAARPSGVLQAGSPGKSLGGAGRGPRT